MSKNLFTAQQVETKLTREPRDYQCDAVTAVWDYIRHDSGNPCIVIPTGGGKSLVLAMLIRDALQWGGRVVVLSHVKELLEQNAAEIEGFLPGVRCGVYSAGLNRRELDELVTVAGIQSIYTKAFDLCGWDAPKIVIVDEAHLISEESQSRYQSFLRDLETANPALRIIGLTATPYRTGEGYLCAPNRMLNKVVYDVGITELIERGFLCNVVSKNAQTDTSGIKIRRGEFVTSEAEELMMQITSRAIEETLAIAKAENRKSVLIFGQTVAHGKLIAELLRDSGQAVAEIYGDTPKSMRKLVIKQFKDGEIKYLVNCAVLTTGFNAPCVDLLVMLRATVSPGLFVQCVGRGTRTCEGKTDCRLLDYGGNLDRHGPINYVRVSKKKGEGAAPGKTCPDCSEFVLLSARECSCGYQFPEPEPETKIETTAEKQVEVIASEEDRFVVYDIESVTYIEWEKRNKPDAPHTLRVDYHCEDLPAPISEWVCVEHEGYAARKAKNWWTTRCLNDMPTSAAIAAEICKSGFPQPEQIRVDVLENPRFPRIVAYRFAEGFKPVEVDCDAAEPVEPLGDCFVCGFEGQHGGCGEVHCPFGLVEEAPF